MMRVIRIICAALLLISVTPLEAFCHDTHCADATSSCTVNCHHAVNHNIIFSESASPVPTVISSRSFSASRLTYKNPTVVRLKKPPIVVS